MVWLCQPILFSCRSTGITPCGLPHSVIRGSQDICSFPRLFAACHDLLRLVAPRHPPWTYIRLTILSFPCDVIPFQFRSSNQLTPHTFPSPAVTPSQLSQPSFPSLFHVKDLFCCVSPQQLLGLIRVELMTPSLSEKCSNRLSYSP